MFTPTCYKFQIRAYFSYRLNDTLKREITSTANMLFYVNTLLSFSLFPIQTHICLSQATANTNCRVNSRYVAAAVVAVVLQTAVHTVQDKLV